MARRRLFDQSKHPRHPAKAPDSKGGQFAEKQEMLALAYSTEWAERISGAAGRARAGQAHEHPPALVTSHTPNQPDWAAKLAGHMDREGRTADALHEAMGRGEVVSAPPPPIEILMDRLSKLPSVNLEMLQIHGQPNLFTKHAREIPRSEMPQLPETAEGIKGFVDELDRLGVHYELRPTDPRELYATQNELDSVKVAKLYHAIHSPGGGWRPESIFFAAQGGEVLDGHHRWGGASLARMVGDDFLPNVMWIDMPIDDLLKLADRFSGEKVSMSAGFRS